MPGSCWSVVGDELVVVRTGFGDVVAEPEFGPVVPELGDRLEDALGTALGNEPSDGLDDEDAEGSGLGDDAGPGCAAQWNGADLAGHFAAAATETRLSFPDARQAVTVTCWPDVPDGPRCAAQWNGADFAGHFAAAATPTRLSFPDARQAVTVTCWPDAPDGPRCAAQWNGANLAGHFAAAATQTRLSFPDARQAVTVTCWPDAPDVLAKFTVSGARLPTSAYPPTAAAISTDSTAARETSFLGFL